MELMTALGIVAPADQENFFRELNSRVEVGEFENLDEARKSGILCTDSQTGNVLECVRLKRP